MKTNERSKCRPAAGWRNRTSLHVAVRWAVVCLLAACWTGRTAAADDAGSAAKPAKRPLIWIQVPEWTGDDHNWGGPYDGPSARRMCLKILKDEAARLGIELTSDAKRIKQCDGALSLSPQSPQADMPFVDVLFQGHRVFFDAFLQVLGLEAEAIPAGLHERSGVAENGTAPAEGRLADEKCPRLRGDRRSRGGRYRASATGHDVSPRAAARLDEEIRKVSDQEAAAVAADYMHQGRMVGTIEGSNGYQKMPEDGSGYPKMPEEKVDPVRSEKAKQATIAAARFYLGCRNLLAAENCQALTLTGQAKYGAAPVLAFSGLADNGVAAAFDRDATLMLLMTGSLLERAGFVHGPLAKKGENVFMASYFTCPTRLDGYDYEPPASFSIGPGAEGKDFGIQVRWRKGEEITRLQLKNSKVLMARGKVCYTDITLKEGYRTAVAIELEDKTGRPDTDAPNCVIVYGNCSNEMSCLARLVDLEFPAAAGVLVPK